MEGSFFDARHLAKGALLHATPHFFMPESVAADELGGATTGSQHLRWRSHWPTGAWQAARMRRSTSPSRPG